MKKIAITIIVVGVAVFIYARLNKIPINKTSMQMVDENGVFHPYPSNATFIFDDGPITLSEGQNKRVVVPGSALTEETTLTETVVYGDINADNKEDSALFLVRSGAGSGTFIYLAAFVSGPVTYRGSKVFFIGDRIAPQSISINKGVVTIKYLDRGPDEPFAAEPTIEINRQFVYKNGEFQER